jgi:very-short-patch-repair endonuclease
MKKHKNNCKCCVCRGKRGEYKGKNNPNYGNHKLVGENNPNFIDGRCSNKYYCIDCEKKGIKTKISYRCWRYGTKKCQLCAQKGKNGFWFGKTKSKKTCEKISETLKKRFKNPKNHGMFGKHHKERTKEKIRSAILKARKEGKYNIKFNIPEKKLDKLLGSDYKFVGNGEVIIGGFNPDFINCNGQKVIEMFGDYWHNLPKVKKRDKIRLKTYKKYGYSTLIVWEHELKDIDKLTNRLMEFNGDKLCKK